MLKHIPKMNALHRYDWRLAMLATAALGTVMLAAPDARAQVATSAEIFFGHDDRLNNDYDWAHGLWKGECGGETPIMLGMSFSPEALETRSQGGLVRQLSHRRQLFWPIADSVDRQLR